MFKQQNDQILALRIVSTRDNLRNLSDKYVADSGAIAVSTDNTLPLKFPGATDLGNQVLDRCRNGNPAGATTCPTGSGGAFPNCCPGNVNTDFSLVDPGDPAATNKKWFSGITSNPTRYDVDGVTCTTASNRCILQLTTSFIATCPLAAASCTQASSVSTSYRLQLAPTFSPPAGPILRSIASSPVVIGSSGSGFSNCTIVTVNSGASIAIANCPASTVVTGGGCGSFWPGANSIPQANGWYCSNTTQNQGGTAFAICCSP